MRPTTDEIGAIAASLRDQGYVADRALATALFLSLEMEKPLLLEGPAGVGKTEMAKVLAAHLGVELIRLQCYEGLDQAQALYEWDYARQLLRIRLEGESTKNLEERERDIFSDAYLLRRPLLEAISAKGEPPVLLIDEVDRADEAFEAFLLEVLSYFQVTVPEIGTIRAKRPPRVILTSNRTRELGDALRRRCLYQWIPYPTPDREEEILRSRLPGLSRRLAREIATAVGALRERALAKPPGVAESLDWARALLLIGRGFLDEDSVRDTLACLLKDRDDVIGTSAEEILALAQSVPGQAAP